MRSYPGLPYHSRTSLSFCFCLCPKFAVASIPPPPPTPAARPHLSPRTGRASTQAAARTRRPRPSWSIIQSTGREGKRSNTMSSRCPFAGATTGVGVCPVKAADKSSAGLCPAATSDKSITGVCPVTGKGHGSEHKESTDGGEEKGTDDPRMVPAKCPFGYDSNTFKLGPLSCIVCQALLHESSKCKPCAHKFCKACISRFKDCPLCGADIEGVEPDAELQALVDRFIDGHARIKRSHATGDVEAADFKDKVIYEDVSMERGAFLVQQAMRAFHAQNIESAKSRLTMCADDIREELKSSEDNLDLCSQLGAVLGMLGDCCRTLGDAPSAITYYEESAEILSKLPTKDLELVHSLSVSLNKIGDLRYYDGDLQSARNYYARSLDVRRSAVKENSAVASQISSSSVQCYNGSDVIGKGKEGSNKLTIWNNWSLI
ncbi:protein NCA1-like isoform X3 [Miscanthus floridulus]|uniref:protein NCA1-like isoform X3 n=1 Tax=Miscanthus floridulus TaxID=154761 RepID=UPI003457B641